MTDNNQTPEEQNAQHEANAEKEFTELAQMPSQVDWARIRAIKMKEYVTSIAHTFQTVDINTTVGVFMYEGSPFIATFYRTVDNLMDDGWSLDISRVEFVGSFEVVDDALESGWIMRCEEYSDDDDQ